jgi:hypothetical protein
LPVLEQDEARLTRDIKVNTDLYTALSNTAQQLRLISVGRSATCAWSMRRCRRKSRSSRIVR